MLETRIMTVKFLGQGFEPKSVDAVGNYLVKYLNSSDFHTFTAISAFASEFGIFGLSRHIQNAKLTYQEPKKVTLIVGIDQQGTSKEALEEIKNINVGAFIFYQSENPIFHPKIYLFEGNQKTKLIVGSSNLTGNGLFVNVEGSLLIEFDNDDIEGTALLDELKAYYRTLFDLTDPNLYKVSDSVISEFVGEGLVPDESTRKRVYNKKANLNESSIAKKESSFVIPKRRTANIPSIFARKSKKNPSKASIDSISQVGSTVIEPSALLWESGPLTERDLNIPKGPNTNPTGSMLFKKGNMEGIDQRHYFRDDVFSSLNWVIDTRKRSTHLEKAAALFRIVVSGKDHGTFGLTLTHNPKTNTRSYEQKNSMTSVSWGDAKVIVAKRELIGKIAKLYSSSVSGEYVLIID